MADDRESNKAALTFQPGDIFYTRYDGKYQLYKVLRLEQENSTYHVLSYAPQDALPGKYGVEALEVWKYHYSIHQAAFEGATLLVKSSVSDDELIGYYEYMKKQDEALEDAAVKATEYYQEAYLLTDEGKYEAAIEYYSKAISLVPSFYQAIDNRAFCKMDLGRWRDAIADFKLSLEVHPESLLAEFSIGECYYRLHEFALAKQQFETCLRINPTHGLSSEFLIRSEELMKARGFDSGA